MNRRDNGLWVFRCPLPDFVAASLCRALFMEVGSMQKSGENRQEKQRQKKREGREQVRFIVIREFSGSQTMQEVFEQLIERQACERFEEWIEQKAG